jgi:hypothetical protein
VCRWCRDACMCRDACWCMGGRDVLGDVCIGVGMCRWCRDGAGVWCV